MTDKKKYEQPDRLAGLEDYGGSASLTVRFVAGPTKRGEQSLAALDMARNFDALPDVEQERLTEAVRQRWEARDAGGDAVKRLERLDWLECALQLRRSGMSAAEMQTHTGEGEAEVQSLLRVTDAIERWLEEESAKRERRSAPPTSKAFVEQSPQLLSRAYAGTPGLAYVDDFLPGIGLNGDWIADAVNTGALLVCPRCFFVHLPRLPLPLLIHETDPPPVDACDVCAHAPAAAELNYQFSAEMFLVSREELGEARTERALLFFQLWMGASLAADTWVLAALGDALAGVKDTSRREVVPPAPKESEIETE